MQKFSVLLVFFVVSHQLCLAQNGYTYPRPEAPSAGTSPIRPGFPPVTVAPIPGTGAGFPSSTPSYGGTGYPGVGRPSGPAFPPSPGAFPSRPQSDTPTAPGFGGTTPVPVSPFPGRPGPTGPSGPSTGYPSAPGIPSRPVPGAGFPSAPSYPTGSRPGFPGGTQYPTGGTGTGGGAGTDGQYEGGDYSAIPGEPGVDYPIYSEIPQTSFDCNQQQYPGYYADVETQCQVFHICALNRTYDFLCPNGTIFSQEHLVCVWWNQFDCSTAPSLYGNNAFIYDYSQIGQGPPQTGYPGPAAPGTGLPGVRPPTGPSATYPGASRPTGPTAPGYPGTGGRPTGPGIGYPAPGYPGVTGPQGPSVTYPGAVGPQGPSATYPGAAGPQGPSVTYPGAQGPTGPTGFPGTPTGPVGPTTGFPARPGTGGATPGFPATSRPTFPAQGDTGFPVTPQTPNREYLPPRRT